jgi:hypothetical protein
MNAISLGVLAFIVSVVALAVWKLNAPNWNQPRSRISDFVSSLVLGFENGAFLRIRCRKSPVVLRLVREAGSEAMALVRIEIDRTALSTGHAKDIEQLAESYQLKINFVTNPDTPILAEMWTRIDNIWDSASGVRTALIINEVLNRLAIPHTARFDFKLAGEPSRRMHDNLAKVRQLRH